MEANLGLYELNRSIIEQQGTIDPDTVPSRMTMMKDFVDDTNNEFYMLYGKETGYFTVFKRKCSPWELETLDMAVIECLVNVGPIYSIELTENKDAIEIWVKDTERDLLTCMYLFPYDNGVVRLL